VLTGGGAEPVEGVGGSGGWSGAGAGGQGGQARWESTGEETGERARGLSEAD